MVSRLSGAWIPVETDDGKLKAIAAGDQPGRKISLLIWNYDARIPEGKQAIDHSVETVVRVRIRNPGEIFSEGGEGESPALAGERDDL